MTPPLSREQRIEELTRRYCQTRDADLRNQLVEEHLYIAKMVARRFQGKGVEYDDLFQVASLALVKALDRFTLDKGVSFSAYATPTLIGEVKNYFRDRSRLIRLPRRVVEMNARLQSAREELSHELKHSPTMEELSNHMGIPEPELHELIEAAWAARPRSLEGGLADPDNPSLDYWLGREDPALAMVEDRDYIHSVLKELGEVELRVLRARYEEGRSQRDVAREMRVSQMYISRLERRVLERFRGALATKRV